MINYSQKAVLGITRLFSDGNVMLHFVVTVLCHIFTCVNLMTTDVWFAVHRNSFQKFYQEYLAAVHPTEDFYLE